MQLRELVSISKKMKTDAGYGRQSRTKNFGPASFHNLYIVPVSAAKPE